MGREDWILLFVAAAGKVLLPIQLQKSLYLLGQQFPEPTGTTFYRFRAISSGQFSEAVYSDADDLARRGLVAIDVSETGQRGYRATPGGLERAKNLEKQLNPDVAQFLRRTANWVRTRSVDQLVRGAFEPAEPRLFTPRKPEVSPRR